MIVVNGKALDDNAVALYAENAKGGGLDEYSGTQVGACIAFRATDNTYDGDWLLFNASNINCSGSSKVHAEQLAAYKATNEMQMTGVDGEFKKLAVCTTTDKLEMPCGSCLQEVSSLCGNIKVIAAQRKQSSDGESGFMMKQSNLSTLLPEAYSRNEK